MWAPWTLLSGIFLNENVWIANKISVYFVPTRRQAIIWTMVVSFLTHICVTRPQWVRYDIAKDLGSQNFQKIKILAYLCMLSNDRKIIYGYLHILKFSILTLTSNFFYRRATTINMTPSHARSLTILLLYYCKMITNSHPWMETIDSNKKWSFA